MDDVSQVLKKENNGGDQDMTDIRAERERLRWVTDCKGRPIKLLVGIPDSASFRLCGIGQREGSGLTEPFWQIGRLQFILICLFCNL